jgi:DNA polymerase-3 subunit epsilon
VEAADRLVLALAEEGPLPVEDAARRLLAIASAPPGLAVALLDRLVAEDVRLQRLDGTVRLAATRWGETPLGRARFAVVDLETTGLADADRIVEAAVVVVEGGRVCGELELLVGARDDVASVVERVIGFGGDAVLSGHNLRFDLRFLDRELRVEGTRCAAPVLDTLALARRLVRPRTNRLALGELADFFGLAHLPEHRALADARATADLLATLLELAEETGVRTVGDVVALARPIAARR